MKTNAWRKCSGGLGDEGDKKNKRKQVDNIHEEPDSMSSDYAATWQSWQREIKNIYFSEKKCGIRQRVHI